MRRTRPWLDPDGAERPLPPWVLSCIPHTTPPWLVGVQEAEGHEHHERDEEEREPFEPREKGKPASFFPEKAGRGDKQLRAGTDPRHGSTSKICSPLPRLDTRGTL